MIPTLAALQHGDEAAWDAAFDWLWPTAFAVAQLKLQPFLPEDIEDVAIETLEELVEKVRAVKTVEELKPLAASIAHHRAVSRLRKRFAQKRGAGQVESPDKAAGGHLFQRRSVVAHRHALRDCRQALVGGIVRIKKPFARHRLHAQPLALVEGADVAGGVTEQVEFKPAPFQRLWHR